MRFVPLSLAGAWLVELEPISDERGFFARSWCRSEFAERGLESALEQCNISYNTKRGTLRGLHWQDEPHAETKLVRCVRGTVYDVIVDLRPDSPTHRRWQAVELDAERRNALYIPIGFAHGFQTLADGSELLYQMSSVHSPDYARGARWNDPTLAISWPIGDPILSAKDRNLPLLPSRTA